MAVRAQDLPISETVARRRRAPQPLGWVARAVLPSFGSLSLLLTVYLLFTNNYRFLQDSDTGWHIRTGDLIRQTGSVPRTDVFSFTVAGQPWFAWEWLTDVALSALHSRFGLAGVACAAWLVLLAAYALLYRAMQQRGADPLLACALTVFAAVASIVHWLARPHVVSVLLLVVWFALVESYRRRRSRMIYAVPLLIALWANLHGAFAVTFALLAVYAAGEWLEFAAQGKWREWRALAPYAVVAALSGFAALLTPYGFALYGHLIRYLGDRQLLALIDEFKSPDFHAVDGKLIEILLLLSVVAAVNAARQRRFVEVGLVALWTHMTLQSERHVTLAAVALAPIIAEQGTQMLGAIFARWSKLDGLRKWYGGITRMDRQLSGSFVAALVLAALLGLLTQPLAAKVYGNGFSAKRFPVAAADFIEQQLAADALSGHVYAADQFGGYLIYRFAPRVKVFVDGRSDLYRQSSVLDDMNRLAQPKADWAALLQRYDIGWLVLQRDEPLSLIAAQSGQWRVAYADDTAQVLLKQVR